MLMYSLWHSAGGERISEWTACHWLAKLGYELKEVKKGVYVDGHKQEDVIAYWKEFLSDFAQYKR